MGLEPSPAGQALPMPRPPSSVATHGSLDSDSLPQAPSTLKELSKTIMEAKTNNFHNRLRKAPCTPLAGGLPEATALKEISQN